MEFPKTAPWRSGLSKYCGIKLFFLSHDREGVVCQSPGAQETANPRRESASGVIMSDRERLHEIIDSLPPRQVHALLTLLESVQPVSDEEFARRLAEAPEEEAGEEAVARILAAEAEKGEVVSHGELMRRLGL